jgi:hypothetical protein
MSGLKTLVLQPYSKIRGSNTYDHIASQTVLSSNSLHSYYCQKTRHTVDSYPNFFRTAKHRLLVYSRGLIYLLGMSISLRVISRTEVQMGSHGFMQHFPEHRNNLGSSIRHNPHVYSMEIDYPRTIQL